MNKILIVGHESSSFQYVEKLLNECGMSKALPSLREGFSPQVLGATLIKAQVPKNSSISPDPDSSQVALAMPDRLPQLDVAPVWSGLAMDLMLANLNQPIWGWADPDAVQLLEYWKNQDPEIAFVLVYDSPENLLTYSTADQEIVTPEKLHERIQHWIAYHASLLHFFHRNNDRTLLVHSKQVKLSADGYLQQMRVRLNAGLYARNEIQDVEQHSASGDVDASFLAKFDEDDVVTEKSKNINPTSQALQGYLANAMLAQYPEVKAMWEELQLVATLPQQLKTEKLYEPLAAWCGLMEQEIALAGMQNSLKTMKSDGEQKLKGLALEVEKHSQLVSQRTTEIQIISSKKQVVDQKNYELEKLRMELEANISADAEKMAALISEVKKQSSLAGELSAQLQVITEDKQSWDKKNSDLEKIRYILEQDKEEKATENSLLLSQLHQLQEELERFYLEGEKRNQENSRLKKAETLTVDLQNQIKQLTVAKAELEEKSVLEQQDSKSLKKQLQERINTEAELRKMLPVISTDEVEEENRLLLSRLHQVQEELEQFYLENCKLKSEIAPKQTAYYGAAARVKQQLSYRLGAVMISQAKSFGGWVRMPFVLQAEVRRFRIDQENRKIERLPSILQYADASEAERVKQHLSYRLGNVLVSNSKSIRGIFSMPWIMYSEIKKFRNKRA